MTVSYPPTGNDPSPMTCTETVIVSPGNQIVKDIELYRIYGKASFSINMSASMIGELMSVQLCSVADGVRLIADPDAGNADDVGFYDLPPISIEGGLREYESAPVELAENP